MNKSRPVRFKNSLSVASLEEQMTKTLHIRSSFVPVWTLGWVGMPESEIWRATWCLSRNTKTQDQSLAWWADRARAVKMKLWESYSVCPDLQQVSRKPAGSDSLQWTRTKPNQASVLICMQAKITGAASQLQSSTAGNASILTLCSFTCLKSNNIPLQVMRHDISWVLN